MVKFFHAIWPPCLAKEQPPPKASSYLGIDFKPDIRRFQQLVVCFAWQGGLIAQQQFCCPIRPYSNKKYKVSPNKRGGCPQYTNVQNLLSNMDHKIAVCLTVCLFQRHLAYLNHYPNNFFKTDIWKKKSLKKQHFSFIIFIYFFKDSPTSTTYYRWVLLSSKMVRFSNSHIGGDNRAVTNKFWARYH